MELTIKTAAVLATYFFQENPKVTLTVVFFHQYSSSLVRGEPRVLHKITESLLNAETSDCQATYFGKIGRNWNTRLTEHKLASRNGD